jgi:pyruvate dehydrogenase E2 component (dihydrolipoamide acetyltransferase)
MDGEAGSVAFEPRPLAGEPVRPSSAPAQQPQQRVLATPLARRLATIEGLDLAGIAGSGPRGRIKAADVEAAAAARPARDTGEAVLAAPAGQRRAPTLVERTIARRLTEAKQTIPHFYVQRQADVSALEALRTQLNQQDVPRLSVNHFILAAAARALTQTPEANLIWDAGNIVTPATVDVGIAVDGERGLMVPVLRDAGQMTVDEIARLGAPLIERARKGQLQPGEMEGGALTVSNIGMFGASALIPIINPGQSMILGVGAPQSLFRPGHEGQPEARREMTLSLSCDHRVLNGVTAAKLLERLCRLLEAPLQLLRR